MIIVRLVFILWLCLLQLGLRHPWRGHSDNNRWWWHPGYCVRLQSPGMAARSPASKYGEMGSRLLQLLVRREKGEIIWGRNENSLLKKIKYPLFNSKLNFIRKVSFQVFMVTGGYTGSSDATFDTTETFASDEDSWVTTAAKLPRPMRGLRAATFDDRVLIFGNYILFITHQISQEHNNCRWTL